MSDDPIERHTPPLPDLPDAPRDPGALTLDQVHAVLQAGFGWLDSHLHRFWPGPPTMEWRAAYFLTGFDVDEGDDGIPEQVRPVWMALRATTERTSRGRDAAAPSGDHRAVALARAALWPEGGQHA